LHTTWLYGIRPAAESHTTADKRSPYERFTGRRPKLVHLVEFGTEVHCVKNWKDLTKLEPGTVEGHLTGFTERTKNHRVHVPQLNKVIFTSDAIFSSHQRELHTVEQQAPDEENGEIAIDIESRTLAQEEAGRNQDVEHHSCLDQPENITVEGPTVPSDRPDPDCSQTTEDPGNDISLPPRQSKYTIGEWTRKVMRDRMRLESFFKDFRAVHRELAQSQSTSPEIRPRNGETSQATRSDQLDGTRDSNFGNRSSTSSNREEIPEAFRPNRILNRTPPPPRLNLIRESQCLETPIPKTHQEAVTDANACEWSQARGAQLKAQKENETWIEVKRPETGTILTLEWVYTLKKDAHGAIERFKARVVARGYEQREGIDYLDTYAPVARLESLRTLIAIKV